MRLVFLAGCFAVVVPSFLAGQIRLLDLTYPLHDYVNLDGRPILFEYRSGLAGSAIAILNGSGAGFNKTAETTWEIWNGLTPSNADFDNGYSTKLFVLVSDDVNPLAVEIVDKVSGGVLTSFSKVAEAVNGSNVRTSIWLLHGYRYPGSATIFRVRFASACTAKVSWSVQIKGLTGAAEIQATGTGSGTSAATATTPNSIAEKQLLVAALGLEGPSNDNLGVWGNSFQNAIGGNGGVFGTTGNPATSNVTLHLGLRTVSVNGQFSAQISGLSNRDWAMVVAGLPLL